MSTVAEHIEAADAVICANIATLPSQRDLVSQNVLGQLRNLVEGVAVRLHAASGEVEYNYDAIEGALSWVKANGRLNFVTGGPLGDAILFAMLTANDPREGPP